MGLKEVLRKIKPSKKEQEELLKEAKGVMKKINKALKGEAKCFLGGSIGKGTNLKR